MNHPIRVVTRDTLAADLRRMGVEPGEALIVHSSLKAIGWIDGGPEAVIDAFQETLTEAGTLAMPAFTNPAPEFSVTETPCNTGLLSETFRRRPGVLRSVHPTHSVTAWGSLAPWAIAGHEYATALGVDSPLHRLSQRGARVLMVGVDCCRCSLIHVAEAMLRLPYLGVPYPGYDLTTRVTRTDGTTFDYREREFPGDSSHFGVVQEECERRGVVTHGALGGADCLLIRGKDLLDAAVTLLERDPTYLLCGEPTCIVCAESRRVVGERSES